MSNTMTKRSIFHNIKEIAQNFFLTFTPITPPSIYSLNQILSPKLYTLHVHLCPHFLDNNIIIKDNECIRKAKKAGYQAAKTGLTPLSSQQLINKGLNEKQIGAYNKAYQNTFVTQEIQKIRKIQLSAYQAAKYGCKRPSRLKLETRGYSSEEIFEYYHIYDKSVGSEEEQLKRKAYRMAAYFVRKKIKLPTYEQLLKRGLDDKSIAYFHEIYDTKSR